MPRPLRLRAVQRDETRRDDNRYLYRCRSHSLISAITRSVCGVLGVDLSIAGMVSGGERGGVCCVFDIICGLRLRFWTREVLFSDSSLSWTFSAVEFFSLLRSNSHGGKIGRDELKFMGYWSILLSYESRPLSGRDFPGTTPAP